VAGIVDRSFRYGRTDIVLSIPEGAKVLEFNEPVHHVSEQEFTQNLKQLLDKIVVSGEIALVVADKTRLCGYDTILPWIVQTLSSYGISDEQICFYIAYGTHPRQSDEECFAAYGGLYARYRFVHHDCSEEGRFTSLGRSRSGTEAKIRSDVFESDLIITIGTVSHHYFAGYGGGRKLLFPGLAEKRAIYANHRLFLDSERMGLAVGCWPGNLTGNPLAGDLKEIHDMLPDYLSIHAILDSGGAAAGYYFGSSYDDFLAVCASLDRCYKLELKQRFDLIIASAGGYPKDINMIQVHKSIHNAANLVRDGGTLIMLAACADGVGSKTFLPYFEMGGREAAFSELVNNYVGNGGTALAMMEKTERIRICLVTSLPEATCVTMNIEKISIEAAAELIVDFKGTIGCVDNGSVLVTERWADG